VDSNQQYKWGYLILWEFIVRQGMEPQFEEVYGSGGDWAKCFRKGRGYQGTELSRDADNQQRYLTMDFWESRGDYLAFKSQHAAEYKAIDQKCEALTEQERELGRFERVDSN
jgi:heme-degrading monooxygenase HmoA